MVGNKKRIIEVLIDLGEKLLEHPRKEINFTEDPEANKLLNNLEDYPHAFVLACMMDMQIRAERAWVIPYQIMREISSYKFIDLLDISEERLTEIFVRKSLHRFNTKMSKSFYYSVQKIHSDYNNNASEIWKNKPSSATVVRRFLEFKGAGVKISTMAVNILARDFKIRFKDYICIDISPDVQVQRVFKRLGFIPDNAKSELIIYTARELNPRYPGIFDLSCWEIGRKWCRPKEPKCSSCYLDEYCLKHI